MTMIDSDMRSRAFVEKQGVLAKVDLTISDRKNMQKYATLSAMCSSTSVPAAGRPGVMQGEKCDGKKKRPFNGILDGSSSSSMTAESW